MSNIVPIKGLRDAPKASQSRMETVILSSKEAESWCIPPFQRPLHVNEKVRAVGEKIKTTQEIEGVLTLGRIAKDPTVWIVDGQHRIEAFKISGLPEVIADIRFCQFDTMAEMACEFVHLNSALVRMRPDDILRGLETTVLALQMIRKSCEFVGYDNIRRGSVSSPVLGMSAVLRCWNGSAGETPTSNAAGQSVAQIAEAMDATSVSNLIAFLSTAHAAWGRDPEYFRLWGSLNLTICMWMWRRLVIDRDRGVKRSVVLTIGQFKQCLMSISADGHYLDWLVGRMLSDRDRGPCYAKVKTIFARRLMDESKHKKKPMFPQPAWASK